MEPAIDNTDDCKDNELDAMFIVSFRGIERWHYACCRGEVNGIDNVSYGGEDE